MSATYAVYGASGFGREVMPLLRDWLNDTNNQESEAVFIDDGDYHDVLNGCRVLSFEEFLSVDAEEKFVVLAIANSELRQKLSDKCILHGFRMLTLEARNIVKMDEVELGEGAILCPFVTLTSNITVGRQFHANIYSYVAHDCVIGDYVTFAPGVKCNGNVVIEDFAYIGTGAVLKQGVPGKPLRIGEGAVVGMGAVVTKDVEPYSTVVGNPARVMVRQDK